MSSMSKMLTIIDLFSVEAPVMSAEEIISRFLITPDKHPMAG